MKLKSLSPLITLTDVLPRRHGIHAAKGDLSCQPFFVVGSGRNGSTMFSAMLDAHPEILVPTEQWRFPNMILKYKLYNFLPWKELVSLIIGEIAANNSTLGWDVNFGDALAYLQYLPKQEQSLQKILDEIYKAYGDQNGKNASIWGEKSPKNTPLMKYIYKVYPKGKYIFLIRDGRDVARSWLVKNKSKDIEWIANSWNESIQMYGWLKRRLNEEQLHLVRYEELVSKPETVLTGVSEFLGYEYTPAMLAFQKYARKIDEERLHHFQKLETHANTTSIGQWKDYFKKEESELLHRIMGNNLQKFGYEN